MNVKQIRCIEIWLGNASSEGCNATSDVNWSVIILFRNVSFDVHLQLFRFFDQFFDERMEAFLFGCCTLPFLNGSCSIGFHFFAKFQLLLQRTG